MVTKTPEQWLQLFSGYSFIAIEYLVSTNGQYMTSVLVLAQSIRNWMTARTISSSATCQLANYPSNFYIQFMGGNGVAQLQCDAGNYNGTLKIYGIK